MIVLYAEEDWGEGLKVLSTYLPDSCEHRAEKDDVIHYHYVGRLDNGKEFGKRSEWSHVKLNKHTFLSIV